MTTTTRSKKAKKSGARKAINKFFKKNPEAFDSVVKASFAYHLQRGEHPNAHYFLTALRDSRCHWCGRTREQVRWDKLPAECANPQTYDIPGTILAEEKKFDMLIKKAKTTVNTSEFTGEDLCRLHHTKGIDPSMLECAGHKITQQQHDSYLLAYAKHKKTGSRGLKKITISIEALMETKSSLSK